MKHTKMVLVGGWCLVLFSILFIGITIVVNSLAQAQTMLYNLENHQLFQVTAGTPTIRFLLSFYAMIPLLIIPGAVGAFYLFHEKHAANMMVGMLFATVGALAISLSLLMIPSLNWHLTSYIPNLPNEMQGGYIILLQAIHSFFGIFIGDLLGLGSWFIWFLIASFVILHDDSLPRMVGIIQLIIVILAIFILSLRNANILPSIYNNIQVPGLMALWIFIFGISMISLHKD